MKDSPFRMRLLLLLGLLAVGTASAQAQGEMTRDACDGYREADAELNAVYRSVMTAYADDAVFTVRLRDAQRAWIAFRDAHMASRYPMPDASESPNAVYGSAFPMCNCLEVETLTRARTAQLRAWLRHEEGEVCSGSARPLN